MTTTIKPDTAAPASGRHRLLPIMANLLPQEIVDARRTRRVKRRVIFGLCVFLTLLTAWFGVSWYQKDLANDDLIAAEDEVRQLTRDQQKYAELVRVQTESATISGQLAQLLANDLPWSTLIAAIQQAAPAGIDITGFTGALEQDTGGSAASGIAGAAPALGSVTINGTGSGKTVIASYVDALAKVPGLANPFLTSVTEQTDTPNAEDLTFVVRVDITKAALGGRHTATTKAGK